VDFDDFREVLGCGGFSRWQCSWMNAVSGRPTAAGRGMRAVAAIRVVAFWDMVAKPGL
jgi:hypothetical protein